MIRKTIINFCVLYAFFQIFFLLPGTGISHEYEKQGNTWSFVFDNCTLSEALSQIEEQTDMQIILVGVSDRLIYRSYENQNIEEIIKDLLFDVNHALSISTGDDGKRIIKVLLVGKSSSEVHAVDADYSLTLTPPEPKKRKGLESPPSPPGVPMPGK